MIHHEVKQSIVETKVDHSKGDLTITILEGKLSIDTELIGNMEPFIALEFNGKKYKTQVHSEGGKSFVWNY